LCQAKKKKVKRKKQKKEVASFFKKPLIDFQRQGSFELNALALNFNAARQFHSLFTLD